MLKTIISSLLVLFIIQTIEVMSDDITDQQVAEKWNADDPNNKANIEAFFIEEATKCNDAARGTIPECADKKTRENTLKNWLGEDLLKRELDTNSVASVHDVTTRLNKYCRDCRTMADTGEYSMFQ